MPAASEPSYDPVAACPLACWRSLAKKGFEYGTEGLPPCATVSNENQEDFGWQFRVSCAISRQRFASRYDSSQACLGQAVFWLKYLGCAGQVDATPRP